MVGKTQDLPDVMKPAALTAVPGRSQVPAVEQTRSEDVYYPDDHTRMGKYPVVALYSRKDWGAFPTSQALPLRHPVNHARFTDTGPDTRTCNSPEECFSVLKELQKDHVLKMGLPDIQYNFLIGSDGTVYEGRGWDSDADRPSEYENLRADCIDIAYIGDSSVNPPSLEMLISGYNFVIYGTEKKHIMKKPKIIQNVLGIDETPELNKIFNKYFSKAQ